MRRAGKAMPRAAAAGLAAAALVAALLPAEEAMEGRAATAREGSARGDSEGARGPAPVAQEAHRVYGWAPGDLLRYRFRERQHVDVLPKERGEAAVAGAAGVETDIGGEFVVRAYAFIAEGLVVGLSIDGLHAAARSGGVAGRIAAGLEGRMREEALVLLAGDGRVARIVAPPSAGPEARNLWRDLLARWQIVRPAGPSTEWSTSEEDPTGAYFACYHAPDRQALVKRKVRYDALHSGGAEAARGALVAGETSVALGVPIVRICGSEEFALWPEGEIPLARSRSEFEMDLVDRASCVVAADDVAALAARLRGSDATTIAAVEMPAAGDREEADDIWTEIERLLACRDGTFEASSMVRIVTALRRAPDAPDDLLRFLDAHPGDDRLAAFLLGALGAAGTDAAQHALERLLVDARRPERRRVTALTALVRLERPTAGIEEALRSLLDSPGALGSSALLLLGATGSRVRESDPARFARIHDELVRRAEGSRDDPLRHVAAIEAIGNLDPGVLPGVVLAALESDEEIVRIAAVQVLGQVREARAAESLGARLAQDPAPEVRRAAARTLAEVAGPESDAGLVAALRSDDSEQVRSACLLALAAKAAEPKVRAAIERAAAEDACEEVRALADRLLAER